MRLKEKEKTACCELLKGCMQLHESGLISSFTILFHLLDLPTQHSSNNSKYGHGYHPSTMRKVVVVMKMPA